MKSDTEMDIGYIVLQSNGCCSDLVLVSVTYSITQVEVEVSINGDSAGKQDRLFKVCTHMQ